MKFYFDLFIDFVILNFFRVSEVIGLIKEFYGNFKNISVFLYFIYKFN